MIRWTPLRKFNMVRDYLLGGQDKVSARLQAFGISWEEFDSWVARADAMGIDGLRVSKVARVE